MTETKMEFEIEIQSDKLRSILAGCKVYSIRRGHRAFAQNLRVHTGGQTVACITNSYMHTLLSEVPFSVFEHEGFQNFEEVLTTLRIFYPEIGWDSKVTILEFRLAL
jgi:hypothetical protein